MCPPQPPAKNLASETEILNTTNNLLRLESGSRSRTSQVIQVRSRGSMGVATPGEGEGPGAPPICTGPPAWSPADFSSSCRCPGDVACCPGGFCCWKRSSAGRGGPPCGGSATSWPERKETHTGRAFQNSAGRPHTHAFTRTVLKSATTCPGRRC